MSRENIHQFPLAMTTYDGGFNNVYLDFLTVDNIDTLASTGTFKVDYDTNWDTNIRDVLNIAMMFELNFVYAYEELSSYLYGIYYYNYGDEFVQVKELTYVEIQKCKYNYDRFDKMLEKKEKTNVEWFVVPKHKV